MSTAALDLADASDAAPLTDALMPVRKDWPFSLPNGWRNIAVDVTELRDGSGWLVEAATEPMRWFAFGPTEERACRDLENQLRWAALRGRKIP